MNVVVSNIKARPATIRAGCAGSSTWWEWECFIAPAEYDSCYCGESATFKEALNSLIEHQLKYHKKDMKIWIEQLWADSR